MNTSVNYEDSVNYYNVVRPAICEGWHLTSPWKTLT